MTDHNPETIRLDQFLKLQGAVGTGGQAKLLIQAGEVTVNGEIEIRRGRKLQVGDIVAVGDVEWIVETD
jgi:ribosome-associated protein